MRLSIQGLIFFCFINLLTWPSAYADESLTYYVCKTQAGKDRYEARGQTSAAAVANVMSNCSQNVFICARNLSCSPNHKPELSQATRVKPWTVLIFMNANNDLSQYAVENLKDMERVGSNDEINIVTQWSSKETGKAVRMLIHKNPNSADDIISPVLQDLGKVDMGDYRNLEDFIQWGVQNFPAQHYFIIVWDHGMGWHASPAPTAALKQQTQQILFGDISKDSDTGHVITTEQLGESMAFAAQLIGHKVDIYGSDACLMAMAEVADQMAESVDYFVGSQALVPYQGLPYFNWLSQWEATPDATPKVVAQMLVRSYLQNYNTIAPNRDVTLSAYDLKQLPAFNQAIANLGAALQQTSLQNKSALITAASATLSFGAGDYADLIDFTNHLAVANLNLDTETLNQARRAANALLIANSASRGYEGHAHGISIWLPTHNRYLYNSDAQRYQQLQFNDDTNWAGALSFLMQ